MNVFAGPPELWLARLRAGHRGTLSRTITAVENETDAARTVLRAIHPCLGRALVVGFTGPPGAGKSTLINAYIKELRRRGQSVAVVAVDPSSPLTGGAILGDRIRMGEHAADSGVFVRSLAARGHLGGLSRTTGRVVDVMDAAGRDVVIVETVGAGQSEVEIADVARTKVVLCPPGLGDDVQAIKAGVIEVADLLVVTKGDLPLADRTARQLTDRVRIDARGGWRVQVLRVTAPEEKGIIELADAIAAHAAQSRERGLDPPRARTRRLIAAAAANAVRARLVQAPNGATDALCDAVLRGDVSLEDAAARAVAALADSA